MSCREWVCMGDFNELLCRNEKQGGNYLPEWRLRDFRETLWVTQLTDLGFRGYPYTWWNGRRAPHTIRCRLDRVVATSGWSSLFPQAQVSHLDTCRSDHLPILLKLDGPIRSPLRQPKRGFRFEAMWVKSFDVRESLTRIGLLIWIFSIIWKIVDLVW